MNKTARSLILLACTVLLLAPAALAMKGGGGMGGGGGGGNGGGGGGETVDLCVTFRDCVGVTGGCDVPPDRVQSDGGGSYCKAKIGTADQF